MATYTRDLITKISVTLAQGDTRVKMVSQRSCPAINTKTIVRFNTATGELGANESLPLQSKNDVEVALLHLGLNNSARLKDDRKSFWEELSNLLEDKGNPLDLLDPHNEYYWTMKEYFSPQP